MKEQKILLVDDQDYTRQLLRNIVMSVVDDPQLQPRRYNFLQASSSSTALQMFNFNRPELVFLDIELPDGSGLDLLKKFKELKPDCFIVMVSGVSTLENVQASIQQGAASFIVKPFNGEKILSVLVKYDEYQTRLKHVDLSETDDTTDTE